VRRREFIALVGWVLASPLPVRAQRAEKAVRIGILQSGSAASQARRIEAFREALRDLGYVEGRNIILEYQFAEGKFERLPALAGELVLRNIDVFVTTGTPATLAARQASSIIPIVMANVGEAVGTGLVASLARPGGNITGTSYLFGDLVSKRLEMLKEVLPKATEVAVLWNPTNPAHQQGLNGLDVAAGSSKIRLHLVGARDPSDFEGAFSAILVKAAHGLMVLDDGMLFHHRSQIASLALRHRLATVWGFREEVEAGGLIGYGPRLTDLDRRAAYFVDKILKGSKPTDLPVEQPTKFEMVINLKTAKALGLTVPPSLIARADEVIE